MTKHYQNFRLDEQINADLLAMAKHVGKPGNRTAGLYAIIAEWRRLKAVYEARDAAHIARIVRHEEYLDALDRHDEATA